MSERIFIEDNNLQDFLNAALCETEQNIKTAVEYCPHCQAPIRFPLIVSARHLEAFEKLLDIASEYLIENGVQKKIFAALLKRIHDRLNIH